ncbi:NAD(P)/FAD-dependent oxidoreductase [Methylococcus capsulatus]|uniref:Pyridine nucleotide-disulphide oxidoreductase family protein n=1 Tax=Methylococcus capsulatus TaxID=414 RepID=A0AA35UQD8_METCP|nr:FAD-dependent oxidoreductase [Methylococcus capsulatus]QXP86746.1 FAD-dependent oxidoreductase [Methylococcus capsulatus]QXP93576.1 FAD-dependent oxidoreductase [Methylococcus capsulatus]UQN11716.1 FAD-dependent oxidoreductase [Methylococcus capsulatus]CAI8811869.1 Pyridine nucleotide-disulphide oxidoreductase family protein [Methylococcus capsulatus]
MHSCKYLVIGGGMTADAAIRGIREIDAQGSIGLIGSEPHLPYKRPLLSKGLWLGKSFDQIWYGTETCGISAFLGRTVTRLDLAEKSVTDDEGTNYRFEKLLLATGGRPRRFPFGGDDILYFRTVDDYFRLRTLTETRRKFAVIGGGFIGSEIAAALASIGKDVVMIFPEACIGARVFPGNLCRFLDGYYRDQGVELLSGRTVTGLVREGDGLRLALGETGEEVLVVDGVVAGIGIEPETRLAEAAGLPVEGGIVVNDFLQAGHPDVYAAGDAASFFSPVLGRRMHVEHEDNARTMGRLAGRNMAGEASPYRHLPYFYSDLFDLGYEAVGELDSRLETVEDWSEPYHKGVVYYLDQGRVRGVLLWNVWDRVEAARALIGEPGPWGAGDLAGRL